MMATVTLKVTLAERDLLDSLTRHGSWESRSALLRQLLLDHAMNLPGNERALQRVADERKNHPPRRSGWLTRLIGRKE